jgi:deleted-in-malignant-brain-tumors protein 1
MTYLLLLIGAVAYPNARFGMGMGPIIFNNLECTGSELNIFDCPSDGVGVSGMCTHANDAAVMCQECEWQII